MGNETVVDSASIKSIRICADSYVLFTCVIQV